VKLKLTRHGDYERRVNFHVFGYAVFVVFTEDLVRSVTARYNKIQAEPTFNAMHCREAGNPFSHLFFKIGDASPGTIAHESWHVTRYLLDDWTGCGLGNETVAYHLGFLVDSVIDLRNDLIDKGVGVKSKTQEVSDERSTSQGVTNGVQSLHTSRFDAGEDLSSEEILRPASENSSGDSGHCCP
jgi:hypothetical protein